MDDALCLNDGATPSTEWLGPRPGRDASSVRNPNAIRQNYVAAPACGLNNWPVLSIACMITASCGSPVMGLALGRFEQDRAAEGIDQRMDLGGQPAARATHAIGSPPFFGPFAPCWWTRIEDESIIWMSPS